MTGPPVRSRAVQPDVADRRTEGISSGGNECLLRKH